MSEPLLPSDPSRVAGFRLLRRLGAGGMGVVYLGRTETGTLAAVKVIRGESAADAGFRARFAREAELARRVDSPWVVPVLDADAEADAPWLATAFVPGPSLTEAVAAHGPLPTRPARVLGRLLAEALARVHAAGLVHRDVKPGNVLLALDGPRLIDFGIARAADDTALTASGLIVGTPGFLAPEQARGEPAGPASDVFALGGVLVHATTGRPPFGTGEPDALLYRTVHDEPALDAVPEALRPLVARCLAKPPEERPTADELRHLLADTDSLVEDDTPWLPDPVARMIAVRSAEGLALPEIEPTAVDAAAPDARGPGRRRLLLAGGALLLAAGGGTAAALLATRDGDDDEPSAGPRPTYVLGVHTTEGAAAAPFSRACEDAARLAVDQHNATRGRAYDLRIRVLRDHGDASGAREVAQRFSADRAVVAVFGPVGEIPMRTAANVYGAAGLTHVSSTTGQQDYYLPSPKSSFQTGVAHTALGGWIALHAFLTGGLGRLGLILDRSGGPVVQDQATLLVGQWRDTLGATVLPRVVAEETDDGRAAVRSLLDAGVTAVAYLGPLDATVRAAQDLAAARFDGPRWMQHLLYGSEFPRLAGAAGEGWYVVTSAVDPSALTSPEARDFTAAWRRRHGTAPGPYATEAYDTVRMLLAEFAGTVRAAVASSSGSGSGSGSNTASPAAGSGSRPARAALAERLAEARYQGIARPYRFGAYHQYEADQRGWADGTFVHQVSGGRFRQLGSLTDLERTGKADG
ncbi:bifunctional serine/threonine-protein kinase/ABC transporter substrate-binding protein [Streptomyces sp. Amel2xC10]|uniref:bifunctional serine/threonine-protein kinase/ABC transporter substrate-binding protein n=1 Tax=Streptomyces sp. Amel2xC10 TaxID=1305826 RepID=UPI000A0879A9|nr:bifunctional serine/threonine-protein kinase/ABC transporter substrate-binding protein [Streptomyces sp. Amel2xC10]SMF85501.1 Serine/threonine protein kinase [Streptomyces sp. Amel2xC10]